MSLGFARQTKLVNLQDTARLTAVLYDDTDQPESEDVLVSVTFLIQRPDGARETVDGVVEDDGTGTLTYASTDLVGQYKTIATFAFDDGTSQSTRVDFEVIDPFDPPAPSNLEVIASYVWDKVEDCFDAEEEGPWLRDQTLNVFNEAKMADFVGEGLFELNERPPKTTVTLDYFFAGPGDPTADLPLLAQCVFLPVMRHLMRSYVEQPQPQGAQVLWQDRRDYLQRWGTIYQIEKDTYDRNAAFFKRRFMGIGHSSILVDTKAGRLLPAPLRVRTTGRGYY